MKTRCKNCRKLIDFKNTYCETCLSKVNKERKKYSTKDKEIDATTKTSRWQYIRQKVIERDLGCCVLCFIKDNYIEYKRLQVHHLVKRKDDLKLIYDMTNLITLCKDCHEKMEDLSTDMQYKILGDYMNVIKNSYN